MEERSAQCQHVARRSRYGAWRAAACPHVWRPKRSKAPGSQAEGLDKAEVQYLRVIGTPVVRGWSSAVSSQQSAVSSQRCFEYGKVRAASALLACLLLHSAATATSTTHTAHSAALLLREGGAVVLLDGAQRDQPLEPPLLRYRHALQALAILAELLQQLRLRGAL